MRRMVTVTVEGQTYKIPEMWLVGFCRNGVTVQSAVAYWHEQAQMEAAFAAQRAA